MRFRIKAGGPAARFTFDRTPKPEQHRRRLPAGSHRADPGDAVPHQQPQPPAPPVLRAADLDNPYGRYYGKARSWEDILKNKNSD